MNTTPRVFDEIELLRRYKAQKNYSDSVLAIAMTEAGGEWSATYLARLFAGKAKPGPGQREFIRDFLLSKYYWETLA